MSDDGHQGADFHKHPLASCTCSGETWLLRRSGYAAAVSARSSCSTYSQAVMMPFRAWSGHPVCYSTICLDRINAARIFTQALADSIPYVLTRWSRQLSKRHAAVCNPLGAQKCKLQIWKHLQPIALKSPLWQTPCLVLSSYSARASSRNIACC